MDEKVNKFLEKKGSFNRGLSLSEDEINSAISALGRNLNVLDKTSYYKEFLKKYGSIYGSDLYMCGPMCDMYQGYKVDCIVSKHNNFDDYCKHRGVEEEELKYCWLIGEYKDNFYYIDSSENGKGHIYTIDLDGGSRSNFFAEDFLVFLDKLFRIYQENESEKKGASQ